MSINLSSWSGGRFFWVSVLLIVLPLFIIQGCQNDLSSKKTEEPQSFLLIDGFQIPEFPTPDEQLSYTRSSFEEFREKKAALEAMSILFPAARRQTGIAALELAYLRLGEDYRGAAVKESLEAIEEYRKIVDEYSELPEIRVKAFWYIGWIYCDLLDEKEKGIAYYQDIVKLYPNEKMSLLPPAPWISIFEQGEQEGKQSQYIKSQYSWAGIALIEIIRHSQLNGVALDAFHQLRRERQGRLETGVALKLLAQRPDLVQDITPYILEFLDSESATAYFLRDMAVAMASAGQSIQGIEGGGVEK